MLMHENKLGENICDCVYKLSMFYYSFVMSESIETKKDSTETQKGVYSPWESGNIHVDMINWDTHNS